LSNLSYEITPFANFLMMTTRQESRSREDPVAGPTWLSLFLSSTLELHPAQAAEKAIRLATVKPAAERTAIAAQEALVLFAQAAWQIVVWLLRQEGDTGNPALSRNEGNRTEAGRQKVAIRATDFAEMFTHCPYSLQGNYN
jgi:hypothetical protein